MKKIILATAVIAFFGMATPASVVYAQTTTSRTTDKTTPVDLSKLPREIKDAVSKQFPESAIQSAELNETTKTYTLQILPKGAKDAIQVAYNEKGEKIEDEKKS